MGRRTSSGRIGAPTFGGLLAADNTTITTDDDADIILDPTGTGRVLINGDLQLVNRSELRLADTDNSHFVALRSPETVASNVRFNLPGQDGTAGQLLQTDGNGNLSFATVAVSVTDETTDSDPNYLLFTSNTSGTITGVNVNTTNDALEYTPSTGTLFVTALSAGSITETSSITLKENLTPIGPVLSLIDRLESYTYDRKDGSSTNEPGLIAEQVADILPELVKNKNGEPHSIAYTKLSVYLLEAIKELNAKVESLQKEK